MGRSDAGISRARGAFALTVGFIVLVAAAIWLYWTIAGAVNYQRSVRFTQRARDFVFRAQLDEETGMRGFVSTREIDFLRPYGIAQERMDGYFFELERELRKLGTPRLLALVADERIQHKRWHDGVAAPLLAAPNRADATRLQNLGKLLTNRFRHDDAALDKGISAAAADADAAVNIALGRIIIVTGSLGLGFALLYSWFSRQRRRMLAETLEARMLYENEKHIADALQAAFVQKALPVIPNVGFHASYIPAGAQAQVGGDWYDAFELPGGRILFSIGDVAGHGIEAAVIMSRARQAIISNALHETNPGTVLARANQTLMLQEPKMVTAVCGYIDPLSLEISYATAGHPPPVLAFPGQEPFFLEHDGMPLGIMPDAAYGSFTASARDGALLILYTDGVIEHKRDLIEGERRLIEAARQAVNEGSDDPAASVRQSIFGDAAPDDDVAIMTVSFSADRRQSSASVRGFSPNSLRVAAPGQDSAAISRPPESPLAPKSP